ncbi:MAG: DNA-formamidopyrimidine glycosylase family protein [Azospirillaceae bacterium]
MPELPDIEAYRATLADRIVDRRLGGVRTASPFFLRTAVPPIAEAAGRVVTAIRRLGKRLVLALDDDRFLVLHLMIAGRLHWEPAGIDLVPRRHLGALDFDDGSLTVTEAGTKKRAGLWFVADAAGLAGHDRGCVEPLEADRDSFAAALTTGNHTVKRALTDPRLFSGIGNAYSDEILHAARLSPAALTGSLDAGATDRLHAATRDTLTLWRDRLVAEARAAFPEKVTAFREGMAVHGRYGKPCPACGTAVQRIKYAGNETNYCPRCQTGGRLLADRYFSTLLKKDWPRSIEELESRGG